METFSKKVINKKYRKEEAPRYSLIILSIAQGKEEKTPQIYEQRKTWMIIYSGTN
jgi:hypothetical protein